MNFLNKGKECLNQCTLKCKTNTHFICSNSLWPFGMLSTIAKKTDQNAPEIYLEFLWVFSFIFDPFSILCTLLTVRDCGSDCGLIFDQFLPITVRDSVDCVRDSGLIFNPFSILCTLLTVGDCGSSCGLIFLPIFDPVHYVDCGSENGAKSITIVYLATF